MTQFFITLKIFIPLDDVIDPFILSSTSRLVRALIKQFLWWWIVLVPPYSVLQSIKLSIHSKTDEAHIERSDASQVLLLCAKNIWIFFHNTYKSVALCFVVGCLQLFRFCCILDIFYRPTKFLKKDHKKKFSVFIAKTIRRVKKSAGKWSHPSEKLVLTQVIVGWPKFFFCFSVLIGDKSLIVNDPRQFEQRLLLVIRSRCQCYTTSIFL